MGDEGAIANGPIHELTIYGITWRWYITTLGCVLIYYGDIAENSTKGYLIPPILLASFKWVRTGEDDPWQVDVDYSLNEHNIKAFIKKYLPVMRT